MLDQPIFNKENLPPLFSSNKTLRKPKVNKTPTRKEHKEIVKSSIGGGCGCN
jgi:hypothetical protein